MTRQRLSTTVDGTLLAAARSLDDWRNDSTLLEAALRALIAERDRARIDAAYRAYDESPLDQPDAWGDLAAWRGGAGRT